MKSAPTRSLNEPPPRLIVDVGNIDEAVLEAHESWINHSSVYDLSAASQCVLCL